MKRIVPYIFVLVTALATNFFAQRVMGQSVAGTLAVEQVTALKAITIANLDKDTYLKTGGFILERYEDRPAYVFTYSDGIVRKIYLYTVYAATDTKGLGLLAIYVNGKTNERKSFVVPGTAADRKTWDLYLDDLKYIGEKEPGLLPALSFVLSRELATLLGGEAAKTADGTTNKKDEYNFCFAPQAPVTLPDGTEKPICQIRVGDEVLSYSIDKQQFMPAKVTAVHHHGFPHEVPLMGIWTVPVETLTASNVPGPVAASLLEATANHPILTASGPKPLGGVAANELVYRHEGGHIQLARVIRTGSTGRASTVYSLSTTAGTYVIQGAVVLDK